MATLIDNTVYEVKTNIDESELANLEVKPDLEDQHGGFTWVKTDMIVV